MLVIEADNVNEALTTALQHLSDQHQVVKTRNGEAKMFVSPVTTAYYQPQQRVLLSPVRDANPFFHLFESIWMIGGRNDVAFLSAFNSTIGQFSDDGKILHGAYGQRWRHHFGGDQLGAVINQLRANPYDRRIVLSMWDPYIDPAVAEAGGKDVPCNTQVLFSYKVDMLDMTVFNRSNDIIWGCYGANAVHMSFLHEYVATAAGLDLGVYYQISNNLHLYERHYTLAAQLLEEYDPQVPDPYEPAGGKFTEAGYSHSYLFPPGKVEDFDADVALFLTDPFAPVRYKTKFFSETASRMAKAFYMHKCNQKDAASAMAREIAEVDWRIACLEWLDRRHPRILTLD